MNNILQGNVLEVLKTLESESVQCCVTSPPYWGLRDYGTGGQIGLEKTPEEYVAKMVEVFREVKRVLRKDGTLWLNLGDSYANTGTNAEPRKGRKIESDLATPSGWSDREEWGKINTCISGLKPKDLCGIPWRVAFALQADGWWLRQDIIWAKPNPMPESVTDRCTKSHEYIFLLSKSKDYFYDAEAVKEEAVEGTDLGLLRGKENSWYTVQAKQRIDDGIDSRTAGDGYRNKRSVWTITTQPYKEAHFATFPEELPLTCIKAGSKEGDLILDPFSGAGTTCMVAKKLNRRYVGIELNPKYVEMAEIRIETECGTLF